MYRDVLPRKTTSVDMCTNRARQASAASATCCVASTIELRSLSRYAVWMIAVGFQSRIAVRTDVGLRRSRPRDPGAMISHRSVVRLATM